MLLYSLLKNFAICGNKAIPIHESDRVRFLNAKPYPIATKPTEMNAIEALTQHIEEQTSKIDLIMLKLTSITNALDQLQLSQVTVQQGSMYNSPARKMPTSTRKATPMDLTTPAEDQEMTEY